jgi:hypothetical protein
MIVSKPAGEYMITIGEQHSITLGNIEHRVVPIARECVLFFDTSRASPELDRVLFYELDRTICTVVISHNNFYRVGKFSFKLYCTIQAMSQSFTLIV